MADLQAYKKYPLQISFFFIILIALLFRFAYFESMTFGYDQARDAFVAMSIFTKDHVKIIGPTSDIPGLFHGSLYWYLIAPFLYVSGGNPQVPRVVLILINMLNLFFIFFFAKKLFNKNSIALLSAYLFAVSFEAVQYGRWLSNPSSALLSISVFFYGVWLAIHKKPIGVGLMLLGASISMQFQVFLVYLSLVCIFVLIYYLRKASLKSLFIRKNFIFAGLTLFFYIPFVVSEVKFRFQASSAIISFLKNSGGQAGDPQFIIQKLHRFGQTLANNVSANIIDFNQVISRAILVALIAFIIWTVLKKRKESGAILFLFLWFLSPAPLYLFEKNNSYFINIGNIYPLLLLASYAIYTIIRRFSYRHKIMVVSLILGVITISNAFQILVNNQYGESIFSVQSNANLKNEKAALDWIYKESKGETFSVNSVTNPLFIDTTWAYLFDWYGKKKYGYMPMWAGYPHTGNYGEEVVYTNENLEPGTTHFLIVEPETGIPQEYVIAYRALENKRSRLLETRRFGEFTIEKREIAKNTHFLRDDLMQNIPNRDTLPSTFNQ